MDHKRRICVAGRIKFLRTVEGETQEELATCLHISRSCLASYETGRREPDEETLMRVAKHYGVSGAYLTGQVPISKACALPGEMHHFQEWMPSDGVLDISNVSRNGQVALIEFYRFLKERANS